MGLDMFAFSLPAELVGERQVDIQEVADDRVNREFGYWRKFHQLHGWMKRLYFAKGGEDQHFNCNTVVLTPADIDRLEKDAESGLPDENGFFFGNYPDNGFDDERRQEVREFCAKCREAFAAGNVIAYTSWW